MSKEYDKLIRDRVPEILDAQDIKYIITYARPQDMEHYLYKKLDEEVQELKQDKDIHEVIDVIEVCLAIAKYIGYTNEQLQDILLRKRDIMGGLSNVILKRILGEWYYDV